MAAKGNRARSSGGKRHNSNRADRDGDLIMGAAKSRARLGNNAKHPPHIHKTDVRIKGVTPTKGTSQNTAHRDASARDVEIRIIGWNKSKASDNQDGGISSLIKWLEKKASLRLGTKNREVKVKNSRVEDVDLIVTVSQQDEPGVLRLNGFVWAGIKLKVQRGNRSATQSPSPQTEQTRELLRGVLARRYNPELKYLDLSALGQDPELRASPIFDTESTRSKFFPALMRVLELTFNTTDERDAAIQTVSLANNELDSLVPVTTLSLTLPNLLNLDLSGNTYPNLAALSNWRKRFRSLQQLIVTGNPLEQNEPDYATELLKWYPNLLTINNIQVRSPQDAATASNQAATQGGVVPAGYSISMDVE